MKSTLPRTLLATASLLLISPPSFAAPAALTVHVDGIASDHAIDPSHAMCKATKEGKSTKGENIRPTIRWTGAPKEAQSYVVIVSDPDVPADFSKAGKDGQTIGHDEARQLFYHWGLINIPAGTTSIAGGKSEAGTTIGTPVKNDLAKYIPNPNNYGGPCPPWNDARVHHYHFAVYALDEKSLGATAPGTAKEVAALLKSSPHVLAQGETVGTYTVNATLAK